MSVLSLGISPEHSFSKSIVPSIKLIKGHGIEGDCHAGKTVQHRSRLHIRPAPSNLRQVHLIQYETLQPHGIKPSDLGENVTTCGIDLLNLGVGTKLHFLPVTATAETAKQPHAIIMITGLRNPCPQIEKYRKGLQEQFITRDAERKIIARRAGVMSTVEAGGKIDRGMKIVVEKPAVHKALGCV